jgi:hypothetical protein
MRGRTFLMAGITNNPWLKSKVKIALIFIVSNLIPDVPKGK